MRKVKKKKVKKFISNRTKICNDDTLIECPLCGKVHTAKEWDNITYEKCSSRKMKKDFKSITLAVSRRKGSQDDKYYYWCDGCRSVISGDRFGMWDT